MRSGAGGVPVGATGGGWGGGRGVNGAREKVKVVNGVEGGSQSKWPS